MSNSKVTKTQYQLEQEVIQLKNELSQLKQQQAYSLTSNSVVNNHKLFYSIFEEAGIGIAVINKECKIVKFNKSFASMFGYDQDSLQEKSYFDMIPVEKRKKALHFIEEMFSSRLSNYQSEQTYFKNDGSEIQIKLSTSALNDDEGNPEYIIGIAEDITEYKRSEKIREVVYNISNAVNYTDNLYRLIEKIKEELKKIIDANHFYIALYNESEDNFSVPYIISGTETFETFPAEKTLVNYVLKQRKSFLLDYKQIVDLQNKREVFIAGKLSKQWIGVPLLSNNQAIGVIGVQSYSDEKAFTENDLRILEILSNQISASIQKMRSEDAFRIERAYFKELFDNSPEAIAVVDNSSIIININKEFTRLFGYTKEEAIDNPIEDLISTPSLKTEAQKITTEVAKGKIIKIDTKRKKKNGSMVDVSLWGTPILLDKGQIAVYAIFRDISERVESEKKLEEAKEQAEESDRLKTAFLTNMSHEIRTPMNAIIGFSELIAEPSTNQDSREEFVEQIYISSKMLLKLIDDIIDVSQLDSGNIKLSKTKFDLTTQLYKLFDRFKLEKQKENKDKIELLLHNPFGDVESYIETDDFRFNQIFSHLLSNALKYTHSGFIEFGFDIDQQEEPVFYVRDTGIGIPEDKKDCIFNHFTKIEDRTKLYRGTGIGLTITKKLVNLLGGKIWIESNVGIGSIFYFTLPGKVKLVQTNKNSTQTKNYNWAGKRILVAEDDDTNFQVIKASLSRTHVDLHRVYDGKSAVEKCLSNHYDLVLMDIRMPILDGIEATKQIKAVKSNVPIVAQTAYVLKNERDTCLNAGCDEYIPKPVKSNLLLETIDKFIANGK